MKKIDIKRHAGNIAFMMKPYWRHGKTFAAMQLVQMAVCNPLSTLISINMPRAAMGALIKKKSLKAVVLEVAKYQVALLAVNTLANVLARSTSGRVQAMNFAIAKKVQEHSLTIDYKYFDDPQFFNAYTYAMQRYGDTVMEMQSVLQNLTYMLTTSATMMTYLAKSSPSVILAALLPIVLTTRTSMQNNKLNTTMNEQITAAYRKLTSAQRMFLQRENAADMRSTQLTKFARKRYDDAAEEVVSTYGSVLGNSARLVITSIAGTAISNGVLMLASARGVLKKGDFDDVGTLTTTVNAASQLTSAIGNFSHVFTNLNRMSLDAEKIREFFAWESEIEDPAKRGVLKAAAGPLSLELRNVGFTYANSGFELKDMSITVNAGETIAIVGENGAGKSTMAKLLLRLYDVDSGEILINGTPIKEYDIVDLRGKIGVAFQSTNLYPLPLRENLQVYTDAADWKLHEVLKTVGLEGRVEQLGATLDTEVTKEFYANGIMFSGGETQKLGLARLLTGEFGLLLLDEPSSALDPLAEYELNHIIMSRANSATTVMIAHRLSTIRDADRIYLVDSGVITERGTHEELMERGGKYCEMFTKQAENYVK